MKHILYSLAGAACLTACATSIAEAPSFPYADVLTLENRTDEDRARDAQRKPVEMLEFIGLQPGDTVIEMEAGRGYFTPMLAHVVGEDGQVFIQMPREFTRSWETDTHPRIADGSLPGTVEVLLSDFYDMSAIPSGSVDVVTWMQGPHELWFTPNDRPQGFGDADETFAEIFRVLRSGGTFVVLDHAAPSDALATTGGTTHRISPALIDGFAETAGFQRTASSDLFANPEDDGSLNVFDPSLRGHTNQFLVRYTKP